MPGVHPVHPRSNVNGRGALRFAGVSVIVVAVPDGVHPGHPGIQQNFVGVVWGGDHERLSGVHRGGTNVTGVQPGASSRSSEGCDQYLDQPILEQKSQNHYNIVNTRPF